jgi:hypothetical protein
MPRERAILSAANAEGARASIFATVRKRKAEQEAEVKEAEIRDAKRSYGAGSGGRGTFIAHTN